jgi:manganese/zinc/iron transport system substrate-binding protein
VSIKPPSFSPENAAHLDVFLSIENNVNDSQKTAGPQSILAQLRVAVPFHSEIHMPVLFGFRGAALVASIAVVLASLGCGATATTGNASQATAAPDRRYRIVATVSMVTDIVRNVVGDRAEVVGLLGAGVDPHTYKPTRDDVRQLMSADVVFYSGLILEGRMGDTLAKVGRGGKPVYAVTEEIDESFLREPPEFAGHPDPHVWMDVAAWSECVAFVAKALSEFDPPHADEYQRNAAAYRAELRKLDDYCRRVIGTIPPEQRVLVTAHDAFGYFGRAYGIEVRSPQGITTESEASVDDVNRLVDYLVERKIRAIFVESSVSEKNMRAIIEGAADRGWQVTIGSNLFSDAAGPPGTYEGTYIGMLDHNATRIAQALGGEAPPRGLNGQLSEEPM